MKWDEQGGGREIAGIADIARDRRDRKGKTLPRINADGRGSEVERYAETCANPYPNTWSPRQSGM